MIIYFAYLNFIFQTLLKIGRGSNSLDSIQAIGIFFFFHCYIYTTHCCNLGWYNTKCYILPIDIKKSMMFTDKFEYLGKKGLYYLTSNPFSTKWLDELTIEDFAGRKERDLLHLQCRRWWHPHYHH